MVDESGNIYPVQGSIHVGGLVNELKDVLDNMLVKEQKIVTGTAIRRRNYATYIQTSKLLALYTKYIGAFKTAPCLQKNVNKIKPIQTEIIKGFRK